MFFTPRNSDESTNTRLSDYLGMISAIICLIHCLVGPVLVGIGAAHSDHIHEEASGFWANHELFDITFLLIGLIAVYFSASHTHERWMKVLLWMSYVFLAATLLMGSFSVLFQYLSCGAALIVIFAHFVKLKQELAVARGSIL